MSNKVKNMRSMLMLLFAAISMGLSAQSVTITGNVTDTTGEPVIGASVLEKGTTNGVITDFDGNFELRVSGNAPLVFSYVGMKSQEVNIAGKTNIKVVLQDDAQALEEVVVIGYGTAKRKDITGSVASVNADAIAAVPVASAIEAISGKLAGVQITTTEGSPDAEMKIRVRGGGSLTGDNTPLFIVDGFPVESISDIAPGDIESIDVLKDASSTAIYGSRGANGVIIVTTKSGKEGKINVNYNAYISVKKIAKKLDVLKPADYVKWQWELAQLRNDGKTDSYEKWFGNYQDMDLYNDIESNNWQDQVFGRTGHTFNHNLSINGGTEKMKYSFSYNYMDDKAIMLSSGFRRDNLNLKLNSKLNKRVTMDLSLRYSKTDISGGGANETKEVSSADSRLRHAMLYPTFPILGFSGDDASDGDLEDFNLYHPVEAVYDNDRKQKRINYNMAAGITYEIIDNLRLKAEIGYDDYRNNDSRFYGVSTYYVNNNVPDAFKRMPAVVYTNTTKDKIRSTNTLNYDFKKLITNKDHGLNVLLGQEYIKEKSNVFTSSVNGYPTYFTSSDVFNLTGEGTPFAVDNFYNPDDILFSWFGRVNYDYQSKYLVSATFRADGSSKFGEGNRWGYFPSAAVAWRISAEPFMARTSDWLDDLKLRVSYGTAGNNNIPAGQISATYSSGTNSWINDRVNYWSTSKYMANPDLTWETTITRNIGLDYTTLGGRLSGSFEVYLNNTKDLLMQFPVSGTGYDYQYRNMGETQNKGFEASLNWTAINKKNYGLSLSANISFNKNKIKSLGIMDDFGANSGWASSNITNDFWVAVNGQVGEMLGYVTDGRYEVSDFSGYNETTKRWELNPGVANNSGIIGETNLRPGAIKFKKLNQKSEDDVMVTVDDRTILGNANPKHTGGFTLNGRIYDFDLAANFVWSYGNKIYNANKIEYTSSSQYQYRNMLTIMEDGKRWTNLDANGVLTNDPVILAEMNQNTTMWSPYMNRFSLTDWAVEDGSFLRLNTLTLGYTFRKALLSKVKIQHLRLYATGYNLFCWTKYTGFDPEVSTRRSTALTPGVDYSAYPKSRQFVFGLNVNF